MENARFAWRRMPLAVLAVLTGLACGDSAPGGIEGSYALSMLNGEPLPYDHVLGCCVYLSGGLELSAGHYAMDITFRNRGGTEPFTVTEWGGYAAGGASLTFVADSFDFAPLLLSPATVAGDTIALGLGGEAPGAPDQFRARFVRQ